MDEVGAVKDFIGEITKGIFDLFEQAWEEGWLIYFIIILVILFLFFVFQKTLFQSVNIFVD